MGTSEIWIFGEDDDFYIKDKFRTSASYPIYYCRIAHIGATVNYGQTKIDLKQSNGKTEIEVPFKIHEFEAGLVLGVQLPMAVRRVYFAPFTNGMIAYDITFDNKKIKGVDYEYNKTDYFSPEVEVGLNLGYIPSNAKIVYLDCSSVLKKHGDMFGSEFHLLAGGHTFLSMKLGFMF